MGFWHYFFPKRITLPHLCGHEALYCARIARYNGFDQHIWTGKRNGAEHAQAQAEIDGLWEWLVMDGEEVIIGERDKDFMPDKKHRTENFWFLWTSG